MAPEVLKMISQYTVTSLGLYVVAVFRLVIGAALVRVAAASRAPRTLRVLGVVTLVSGVITFFLGVDRAREIVNWWLGQGPVLMRLWPGLALILGAVMVWAVFPRGRRVGA